MLVVAYLVMCFVAMLVAVGRPHTILNNDLIGRALIAATLAAMSIAVVLREQVSDTPVYLQLYQYSASHDLGTSIQASIYDRFWTILQWALSQVSSSGYVLLGVVWLLLILGLMRLLSRLFTPWQVALVLFSYASYPFLYTYAAGAVRQGVAIGLILLAMSYSFNSGKTSWSSLSSLAIAVMFHWSAAPFALIVILLEKTKVRLRHLVWAWCALALLFVTGLQGILLSPLLPYIPKLDSYTSYDALVQYSRINRLDFLLFSGFFVVISLLLYRFYYTGTEYGQMIKYYIAWNCVFLAFGFVTFSDRLAGYSWFLIPILVWFPVLKRERYSVLSVVGLVALSIAVGVFAGTLKYFRVV